MSAAPTGAMRATLGLDFSQFETGARASGKIAGGMADNMVRASERIMQSVAGQAKSFDQLRGSVDPAFAAAQNYASIQRQLAGMVEIGATSQRAANIVLEQAAAKYMGVETAAQRAARAQLENASVVETASRSYTSLRTQLDPVFAASKQYENAQEQLNAAVKAGVITQTEANRVLGLAEAKYLGLAPVAQKVAMAADDVGKKSGFAAGGGMRMLGQQLSQVAQQGAVTGNYLGALAVQLPDIALGFGSVAIAASIVATIAIPAIMSAMGEGKSAAELAADANKAYASSFDVVSQDMAAAADLEAQYTAAMLSGSAQRIQAIQLEATIRQKQLKIDLMDQATAAQASQAAESAAAADLARTQDVVNQRKAIIAELVSAQAAAQSQYDQLLANGMSDSGLQGQAQAVAQIGNQLAQNKAALDAELETLAKQQSALDRSSVAYALIEAKINSANSQLAETDRMLALIVAGVPPIEVGLNNAANAALGLSSALSQAYGYAAGLRSAIDGMNFTNIATAASNAALLAGSTVVAATAAGQLAEQHAKLAPMLGSQDGIIRKQASSQLAAYDAALQTNVALQEQHATLVKTANAASGAGKATKTAMDEAGKAAKKAAKDAADAAKSYADTMQGFVSSGIGGFVDQMVDGFSGGMKSLKDLLVNTIKQMIAYALKNKIMLALGMGGVPATALAGAASAAGTAASGGGGGGLLSGLLGGAGGALGTIGSSLSAGFMSSVYGGLAGMTGAISGGLSVGGLAGISTAIGAIAAPLLAVAAIFSFFKTKTKLLDSGLRLTVNGIDTAVETFKRIKKTKFWGLSSKTSTNYEDAAAEVADPISKAIGAMQNGIVDMAGLLGIGSTAFDTFSKQLQISTKGLSESDALAAVQNAITGLGDDFASLATGLGDFVHDGEGAMAALTRLTQAMQAVNLMTDTLGLSFRAVGLIGADAASQLADAFGGLEALNTAVGNYYAKFYTEAERNATATRQATEALAKLNVSMPQSRDEYRAMIEAQDLTTESGRKLFAALVSMSGVMDQVLPQVRAFSAAVSVLVGNVQIGLGAMITATGKAQSDALNAADAWRDTAKSLRKYVSDMRASASPLISAGQALAYNQSRFDMLMGQALGGNLDAAGQLSGAADALLDSSAVTAHTSTEAAIAQAKVLAGLTQVADFSDLTFATMDSLATLLGNQLTVLQTISDYLTGGGADAAYLQTLTASLGALQIQLGLANADLVAQLTAPMGALTAGLASLVAAINLDLADRAARAAADAAAQSVASAAEAARLAAAAAVAEAARIAAAAAAEAARLAAILAASQVPVPRPQPHERPDNRGFASGGDHRGGLRIVGENGPELEATGPSRIFNASQTERMLKGGGSAGGFGAVVSELRELRREVSTLRDQQRQLDTQILAEERKSRKITEDWNINGMPGVRA